MATTLPGEAEVFGQRPGIRPSTAVTENIGPTGLEGRQAQSLGQAGEYLSAVSDHLQNAAENSGQLVADSALIKLRTGVIQMQEEAKKVDVQTAADPKFIQTNVDKLKLLRDSLATTLDPVAQKYYNRGADPVELSNKAFLYDHSAKKNIEFAGQNNAQAMDLVVRQATSDPYSLPSARILSEQATYNFLKQTGNLNTDTTEGNAALARANRIAWTSVIGQVVEDAIYNKRDPLLAKKILEENKESISPESAVKIGHQISGEVKSAEIIKGAQTNVDDRMAKIRVDNTDDAGRPIAPHSAVLEGQISEVTQGLRNEAVKKFPNDPEAQRQYQNTGLEMWSKQITAAHGVESAARQSLYNAAEKGNFTSIEDIKRDPALYKTFTEMDGITKHYFTSYLEAKANKATHDPVLLQKTLEDIQNGKITYTDQIDALVSKMGYPAWQQAQSFLAFKSTGGTRAVQAIGAASRMVTPDIFTTTLDPRAADKWKGEFTAEAQQRIQQGLQEGEKLEDLISRDPNNKKSVLNAPAIADFMQRKKSASMPTVSIDDAIKSGTVAVIPTKLLKDKAAFDAWEAQQNAKGVKGFVREDDPAKTFIPARANPASMKPVSDLGNQQVLGVLKKLESNGQNIKSASSNAFGLWQIQEPTVTDIKNRNPDLPQVTWNQFKEDTDIQEQYANALVGMNSTKLADAGLPNSYLNQRLLWFGHNSLALVNGPANKMASDVMGKEAAIANGFGVMTVGQVRAKVASQITQVAGVAPNTLVDANQTDAAPVTTTPVVPAAIVKPTAKPAETAEEFVKGLEVEKGSTGSVSVKDIAMPKRSKGEPAEVDLRGREAIKAASKFLQNATKFDWSPDQAIPTEVDLVNNAWNIVKKTAKETGKINQNDIGFIHQALSTGFLSAEDQALAKAMIAKLKK